MTCIVVDKSTDHAKPSFDLFFPTISASKKVLLSGLLSTLNGKLGNQFARLVAIVVRKHNGTKSTLFNFNYTWSFEFESQLEVIFEF